MSWTRTTVILLSRNGIGDTTRSVYGEASPHEDFMNAAAGASSAMAAATDMMGSYWTE